MAIKRFFLKLNASGLISASFGLTLSSIAIGVLGYVYQILMGRLLSTGDFSVFSATMALAMFISSPLAAVFMIISRHVTTLRAHQQMLSLRNFYWGTHKIFAIAAFFSALLLVFLSGRLQSWLKASSTVPVWIFGFSVIFFAFLAINNGFIQGAKRFNLLGILGVSNIAVKILIGTLLVYLGLGVNGALAGVLISSALIWFIGLKILIISFTPEGEVHSLPTASGLNIKSILPVVVANLAFAAMTQLDMVLVNWYFSPVQAGTYAAVSVLGKAVLYVPGGIVLALFPMVAENHSKNKSSSLILLQAVSLTGALCLGVALVYWFFSESILRVMYGNAYIEGAILLKWYGLAILPMSLVMVAEYFLIAKGRIVFAWLFLAISPLQIYAIYRWHESLGSVILIMGCFGLILAISGYFLLWRIYLGERAFRGKFAA